MNLNTTPQSQPATSTSLYKIRKDLRNTTFPASFESIRSESDEDVDEEDHEEEEEEDKDQKEEDEDEDDPDYSDDSDDQDQSDNDSDSDEPDSDASNDSDDVDIDLGYGAENDEPSGFAPPTLFQNPIIFYRGYATQDDLDQHGLSAIKAL
ncbi:MAG: hypothetical protein P4L53_23510 [Candidatus Obscuribacterales bacterium]|nr:hypothetical protein [Candidatus Obscuribacterales bacterium]